ncbi:argonaute-like protein [Collybia nuda]|uniref:Argonaute-like protein n=1 Tax=Collybia nuda TaxID=64659 RepID=A0A9P6CKQ8_9AGAR|nr:argonaute-like protein [Collybia nuda]
MPLAINVNAFVVNVPDNMIYHYDGQFGLFGAILYSIDSFDTSFFIVVITPPLSVRRNLQIFKILRKSAPQVFIRQVIYDGKKNLFATYQLPLGNTDSEKFVLFFEDDKPTKSDRPPRPYEVILTKVQEINLESLHRFVHQEQPQDNKVLAGIMALNIAVRMVPTLGDLPFNTRSFFTEAGSRNIGSGLVLWRGYFQSVRPTLGRMLINVDITTGLMYKPGNLMSLCLEFLGRPPTNYNDLAYNRIPNDQRRRLQDFIARLRVDIKHSKSMRSIKKLTSDSARNLNFSMRDGTALTVENYFKKHLNITLTYPNNICIEVGNQAWIPLELCTVPKGQLAKKQVPPEKVSDVLSFATSKPAERLNSIKAGLQTLAYGQSEYIREFGLDIQTANGEPLSAKARVLSPSKLMYSPGGKQRTVAPANGMWNMVDKRFFQSNPIKNWAIIIYESRGRFGDQEVSDIIQGIQSASKKFGIQITNPTPYVKYENGQGDIFKHFRDAGNEIRTTKGEIPNLMFVVLPEHGGEIYTKVKHFGDIKAGVATQCLKSTKCNRAKEQYWANVLLKVNVKLGGVNVILDPVSFNALSDPNNPTIIMGADVMDPPASVFDRPSYSALVSSVDSNCAKYIASIQVQPTRQQIIVKMYDMVKHAISEYMEYGKHAEKRQKLKPARLIFYRDGVSEGEFQKVLDRELPQIQKACEDLDVDPKITLIVVGKRHHIRFFPQKPADGDRSGNCPAGTVVDTDICHPTDFDYYLLSHGGLLGTSRPSHYYVLHDANGFKANSLQALSFALCHVYARCTRSVSIPAPVYYADIVCSRARNHFDPTGGHASDAASSSAQGGTPEEIIEAFEKDFQPIHPIQGRRMYFM